MLSALATEAIVPEDGEQWIVKVKLFHIEEVNKLAIVYFLSSFH